MDQKQEKKYEEYVKQITPTHSLGKQMGKAFFSGGVICLLGQGVTNLLIQNFSMEKEEAGGWCSLLLILLSRLQPPSFV